MFSKNGQVRTLSGRVDSNRRTMNPEDVPEERLPSVTKLYFLGCAEIHLVQ
jgi:hypothetical protein